MNNECEKYQEKAKTGELTKPKSSGNRNFRKHNKLGFYRLIQRKKKKEGKPK